MSLFDTLRYPITDIFNLRQLEQLPTDLVDKWANNCLRDAGYDRDTVPWPVPRPLDSVIRLCVKQKVRSSSFNSSPHIDDITMMIKEKYTKELRMMIYEYDQLI